MDEYERTDGAARNRRGARYHVRIPGFISDEDLGLGNAIRRVTDAAGIKSCGGCQRRAAALNRWLAFTGSHRK